MKLKKYSYLIAFILMLLIGINGVDASQSKECYYISTDNNFKAHLTLQWGHDDRSGKTLNDYARISLDKIGHENWTLNDEILSNWFGGTIYTSCIAGKGVCFDLYYKNEKAANNASNPKCPEYIVYQKCTLHKEWGTESESIAKKAVEEIKKQGCKAYYASYKNSFGQVIDEEEYYSEFVAEGLIDLRNENPTCANYETIFGKKDDPESVRYMLNEILTYVRIIVPILIILLGTIDFSKAVLAGKEDNMRKAQADFIKRLIVGVVVFLVPTLIDIVMDLAEIVWDGDYIHCGF